MTEQWDESVWHIHSPESTAHATTQMTVAHQVFVTSKISPYEQGHAKAKQACSEILEKLGLDYVDLMLVHWPGKKLSRQGHC